jgi:hypothetical protein
LLKSFLPVSFFMMEGMLVPLQLVPLTLTLILTLMLIPILVLVLTSTTPVSTIKERICPLPPPPPPPLPLPQKDLSCSSRISTERCYENILPLRRKLSTAVSMNMITTVSMLTTTIGKTIPTKTKG